MNRSRIGTVLGTSLAALTALSLTPTTASAAGPPQAATAFVTAIVTPAGGSVSGFGITATFAPGAVAYNRKIILGNWPNGLDVTPPSGTAVKTFGLQECDVTGANCTSELGNFKNSPAGSEKIKGVDVPFTAFQPLTTTANSAGNTAFGTVEDKRVTITTRTGADKVYVYNANNSTTATAYPKLLPSTSNGTSLTFQTFQPIVWTLTAPAA